MRFIWSGGPVEKVNGKWISKCWAMKGPVVTGSMMNKEIPEPRQSQIEKDFKAYLKDEKERDRRRPANRIKPPSRITWTKADGPRRDVEVERPKPKATTTKKKRTTKKKPGLSIKGLEELIKKERVTPKTPRKKRGGVIGGISLYKSKK